MNVDLELVKNPEEIAERSDELALAQFLPSQAPPLQQPPQGAGEGGIGARNPANALPTEDLPNVLVG